MPVTSEMGLVLPTPDMDEGVWGNKLNTALTVIDEHDHTPGKGAPIPSTAITVAATVSYNGFGISDVNEVKFVDITVPSTGVAHENALQAAGSNLYYINGSGTAVQITDGNQLATALSSPALPPGATIPYAGTSAPAGWLLCDGAAVSRTTYAVLFAVIGTVWGVGDGSTTFNVPNMNGRVAVGTGTYTDPTSGVITRSLAQIGGEEAHVLITDELAFHNHTQNAHNHSITDPGHTHIVNVYQVSADGTNAADTNSAVLQGTPATNSNTTGITVDNATATNNAAGGDLSHNNMQPFAGLLYIIKT